MSILGRKSSVLQATASGAGSAHWPSATGRQARRRSTFRITALNWLEWFSLEDLMAPAFRALDAVRGRIDDYFAKPLILYVSGKFVTFNRPEDFEFTLASKTDVPVGRFPELMRLPADELKQEATQIREVEQRFTDLLATAMDSREDIGELMRGLELKLFSQDHGWREIMEDLVGQEPGFNDYRRIALAKYMQYLASRQEVLQSLYARAPATGNGSGDVAESGDPSLKETGIFDLTQVQFAPRGDNRMNRLPRGETVAVRFSDGAEMDMLIARHRFKLVQRDDALYLVDDAGRELALRQGRNLVGRHMGNDAVIDGSYRGASRKHLIIEPLGNGIARLTDLSSHGTFAPSRCLVSVT